MTANPKSFQIAQNTSFEAKGGQFTVGKVVSILILVSFLSKLIFSDISLQMKQTVKLVYT